MGAKALLDLEPNLLVSCMEAMQLDAVCKSASSLLASLLNNLWLQLHTLHQGSAMTLLTQSRHTLEHICEAWRSFADIRQEEDY